MIDITHGTPRSLFIWLTILTLLLSSSVPAFAVPSTQQILFRGDQEPPERGWNLSQGGFAEFHAFEVPSDLLPPGLPTGFLEVDVYHITRSSSGKNYDVAQYVVWSGCLVAECLDSVKHPGGIPIAILTLVDNEDAAELLQAALGVLLVVPLSNPNLLTIKVKDGEIVANIPSDSVPSPLPSGEIIFKNVKKGEKQEMRSIFPLLDTKYVLTQSYTIREAEGSFTAGLDATVSWTTNGAKTIISKLHDNLLPYMLGVITSYGAVIELGEATTDPKAKRDLDGVSEQLFSAITEAQMDKLRTSFDRAREAVRTLERLNMPGTVPIITMLYEVPGMPIGMKPTVQIIGAEAGLTGKKAEEFNKKIAQADQSFGEGKYSEAINRLIEAYNIAA